MHPAPRPLSLKKSSHTSFHPRPLTRRMKIRGRCADFVAPRLRRFFLRKKKHIVAYFVSSSQAACRMKIRRRFTCFVAPRLRRFFLRKRKQCVAYFVSSSQAASERFLHRNNIFSKLYYSFLPLSIESVPLSQLFVVLCLIRAKKYKIIISIVTRFLLSFC